MKGYLGKPGAFLALPYVGKEDMTPLRTSSEKTTLGGRTFVYLAPGVRRSWNVSITGLRPGEMDALRVAMAGDQQGLRWVSPPMMTQNAFTFAQSLLTEDLTTDLTRSEGLSTTADGETLSERLDGSGTVTLTSPVVPGAPVTFSAWSAGGSLALAWRNAAGGQIGATITQAVGSALRRNAVVGVAPTGAAWVECKASSVTAFARPALTWTPWVMPWGYGLGAKDVLVAITGESYETAWRDPRIPSRTSPGVTITEVG